MPKIVSNSDPTNPRPWFEFTLGTDLRTEITVANGLASAKWTNASSQEENALVNNSSHSHILNSNKNGEIHVLAVTLGGKLEFVPFSEQRDEYYAHLAEYDPNTGKITQLEFVEQ